MHELGSIDVMHLDRTLGQSRHVACASGCMSMRASLEEGIKLHSFAGIFPEQFLTEAGRHREAMVAADQRMVIRCLGDDLPGFVHDVFHCDASNPMRRNRPGIGSSDAAALWHAERKLYLGSTVRSRTLCTMPCVSAFHSPASITCPGSQDAGKMEIRTQATRAALKMTVTIPATSMMEVRLG